MGDRTTNRIKKARRIVHLMSVDRRALGEALIKVIGATGVREVLHEGRVKAFGAAYLDVIGGEIEKDEGRKPRGNGQRRSHAL